MNDEVQVSVSGWAETRDNDTESRAPSSSWLKLVPLPSGRGVAPLAAFVADDHALVADEVPPVAHGSAELEQPAATVPSSPDAPATDQIPPTEPSNPYRSERLASALTRFAEYDDADADPDSPLQMTSTLPTVPMKPVLLRRSLTASVTGYASGAATTLRATEASMIVRDQARPAQTDPARVTRLPSFEPDWSNATNESDARLSSFDDILPPAFEQRVPAGHGALMALTVLSLVLITAGAFLLGRALGI